MLLTTLPVRLGTDVSSKLALFLLKTIHLLTVALKKEKITSTTAAEGLGSIKLITVVFKLLGQDTLTTLLFLQRSRLPSGRTLY